MSRTAFNTIYVTGLPRHMTAWELTEICRPYGQVTDARIEHDPETGAQWRFGFVEFSSTDAAARAANALHGSRYRGDVLAARQIDLSPPASAARRRTRKSSLPPA